MTQTPFFSPFWHLIALKPVPSFSTTSSYISGSEQSLYYSSVQKITVTACFNFIGAAKAELEPASLDLLIPVLSDDHQVSLPNSVPDHYFGLRFMLLLVI